MNPLCTVDVSDRAPGIVARLIGEIDLSNVDEVERALTRVIRDDAVLVVDLSDVRYADSAGLRMLEELSRKVDLRLVVPDGAILSRTLQISGLDQVLTVFPTEASALEQA